MASVFLVAPQHGQNYYTVADRRSYPTQAYHIAQAVLRMTAFGCSFIKGSLCPIVNDPIIEPKPSDSGQYNFEALPWNAPDCKASDGLCLFLHGMDASPRQWDTYTRQFSKQFPQTHYLVPSIVQAGNCSLEDAGNPVIRIVEDYLKRFPGSPVTLIGTSNGARLAAYVESTINPELFNAESRLMIISIAGVHGGTKMMDLAHRICCRRCLKHHPDIKRDFSFNNKYSLARLRVLQQRQQVWQQRGVAASHYFYAATEDEQVRTLSSSLPYLESTPVENYQILHGHTHETIVDAVYDRFLALQKTVQPKNK